MTTHTPHFMNYRALAAQPIGELMRTIVELNAPGLVPSRSIDDAAAIQRELMVVCLFKRAVTTKGPLCEELSVQGQQALRIAPLAEFFGPPGFALELFADYLGDPSADLSRYMTIALLQQNAGTVPAEVPSIGVILSSSWAALGADGLALFDRDLVRAALIASACLRALLAIESPRPRATDEDERDPLALPNDAAPARLYLRPTLELGFAVRNAQQIAEKIGAEEPIDPATRGVLLGYLNLAERRFRRDGFTGFADVLSEFRLLSAAETMRASPTSPRVSV